MNTKIIIGIVLLVTLFVSGCSSNNSGTPTGGAVYEDKYIEIYLSDISTTAKHFTFNANGKEVKYFVVEGSDGKVRTAFDACDVCGGSKGYRQEGTDMGCNNCGRAFSIDSLGTTNKGGGSWPSFLSNKVEGNTILISESELEEGAFRF